MSEDIYPPAAPPVMPRQRRGPRPPPFYAGGMSLPSVGLLGVFTALLLVTGCARRMPTPDLRQECRSAGLRFEQTAGACAPFAHERLAWELAGERCDDEALATARQRLRQEQGAEGVDVLRGERLPGSDRHRVVVRYASSEPGTCPVDPKARAFSFCEDCKVTRVFTAMGPLGCNSSPLAQRIIREVKDEVRTCTAESLDAARARVWKLGWFDAVSVVCGAPLDGHASVVAEVDVSDPAEVCREFSPQSQERVCPETDTRHCAHGKTCYPKPDGCEVCYCSPE